MASKEGKVTARRPSPEALREAAEIARDTGVTVTLERAPDGSWLYRIAPGVQDRALGATERDRTECDNVFGVSG